MWLDFFACVVIGILVVFLPGYLVCRALHQTSISSIAFAPLVSVGSYAALGCIYPLLGIGCSWLTTFLPLTAVGAGAFALSAWSRNRRQQGNGSGLQGPRVEAHREWPILGGYILCGILFTGFIFVRGLNGADGFSVEIDNRLHYGLIRDFLASGQWSSLSPAFYPSAMHAVAALIGSIIPTKVVVLSNATLTLFIAFVFPAGMYSFMRRAFPDQNAPVVFGMLFSFCFAAFPWRLLGYGPMTPFLLSLCLLPALIASAMDVVSIKGGAAGRLRSLIVCAFGLLSGAFMQTSVIFSFLVVMASYCSWKALGGASEGQGSVSRRTRAFRAAAVIAGFIALWAIGLVAPFMQGVISYSWAPIAGSAADGLAQTLLFGQQASSEQLTLAVLVAAGFVVAALDRRARWLVFPYLLMAIGYFVVATFESPLEKVLAGFWYTDPIRMAANQCFFAIPLACLALGRLSQYAARELRKRLPQRKRLPALVAPCLGALLLVCVFAPFHYMPGKGIASGAFGPGGVTDGLAWEYSTDDNRRYTADESVFAQKVAEITGNDVVLNNPYDGSCYAWGIDGVNVAYTDRRLAYDYGLGEGSIVGHLSDYATNDAVRQAVKEMGARYVLKLDPGKYMEDYLSDKEFEGGSEGEYPYVWEGIDAVDENTPGFQLVLREGNMSLYRIEDAE